MERPLRTFETWVGGRDSSLTASIQSYLYLSFMLVRGFVGSAIRLGGYAESYAQLRPFPWISWIMAYQGRLRATLAPYLKTSTSKSLTLLTSVLDTSVNWLILRYLLVNLDQANVDRSEQGLPTLPKVALISFSRDWSFWDETSKKLAGGPAQLFSRGANGL